MIDIYIKQAIKLLKENKLSKTQILKIYKMYKRRELTEEEIKRADIIVQNIKDGTLTEKELIDKAIKWKEVNNNEGINYRTIIKE